MISSLQTFQSADGSLTMGARRVTQKQPHRYATEQDLNGSFKVATLPMSDQSNSKLHQSDKYARHNYFEIELFSPHILQNRKSPSYAKDYNYFLFGKFFRCFLSKTEI